jgi:hypothetical protein
LNSFTSLSYENYDVIDNDNMAASHLTTLDNPDISETNNTDSRFKESVALNISNGTISLWNTLSVKRLRVDDLISTNSEHNKLFLHPLLSLPIRLPRFRYPFFS